MRLAFLFTILAGAAALRLWRIDVTPPGFHFDESFEGLEAWRILTDPGYRPVFLTGNFGVPPLNSYANALTFSLFERFGGEAGPTAMRVTAAFFGVLGVAAIYALACELVRLDREGILDRDALLRLDQRVLRAARDEHGECDGDDKTHGGAPTL